MDHKKEYIIGWIIMGICLVIEFSLIVYLKAHY